MKIRNLFLPTILCFLAMIYYFSFEYVNSSARKDLLNQQVENAKIQANLISNLLNQKLKSGSSKEAVKKELQKSIENLSIDNSFICMFDDTGKEICHPNKERIGQVLSQNNSLIKSISNTEIVSNFKQAIQEKQPLGGLRKMKEYSEIVYLSPVKDTDWIVASHVNLTKFKKIFSDLKEKLALIFILIWLSTSLLIYFFLQWIYKNNLKEITDLNRKTGTQYFNELKIIKTSIVNSTPEKKEIQTKRFLADKGAQLTPVHTDTIAYIYTQNKITYLIKFDGEKLTINLSLDDLFKSLDKKAFYRASRQVIISANAIERIEKYGNTQLKVLTKPASSIEIIISKAKLSEFKRWAGKN